MIPRAKNQITKLSVSINSLNEYLLSKFQNRFRKFGLRSVWAASLHYYIRQFGCLLVLLFSLLFLFSFVHFHGRLGVGTILWYHQYREHGLPFLNQVGIVFIIYQFYNFHQKFLNWYVLICILLEIFFDLDQTFLVLGSFSFGSRTIAIFKIFASENVSCFLLKPGS